MIKKCLLLLARTRTFLLAGVALGTLAVGCGTSAENQGRQLLGDPGTCTPNAPGDCASCDDLLDTQCWCKGADGAVVECEGAELDRCEADKQAAYDHCVRSESCKKTVLEPALAACPDKNAPGGLACIDKAWQDYQACVGAPSGSDPGGTR